MNDKYTMTRIVETEVISELKQWLIDNKCKCKVTLSHCDPYFWLTSDERKKLTGPIGVIGAAGPRNHEEAEKWNESRVIADSKQVMISFEFTMSNSNAEKIVTKKLSVTTNHVGDTLPYWNVRKITESIPYMCGIYKVPRFDTVYTAYKTVNPDITEEEFATNKREWGDSWDKSLVELRLFEGDEDCLRKEIKYERIETGKSQVYLSLLAIDIRQNLEYVKSILLSAY